jgi:hypothetical protein
MCHQEPATTTTYLPSLPTTAASARRILWQGQGWQEGLGANMCLGKAREAGRGRSVSSDVCYYQERVLLWHSCGMIVGAVWLDLDGFGWIAAFPVPRST